jgi:hypothetical protein
MKASNGAVTYDSVLNMTFLDLADLWEAAISTR